MTVIDNIGKRVLFIINGTVGCYIEGYILRMSDNYKYVKVETDGNICWYKVSDISIVDTLER